MEEFVFHSSSMHCREFTLAHSQKKNKQNNDNLQSDQTGTAIFN